MIRIVEHQSDRHQPDPGNLGRDQSVRPLFEPLMLQPEQRGLRRTVKIDIEQTDLLPLLRKHDRQRSGDGALADAALAGEHQHGLLHMLHPVFHLILAAAGRSAAAAVS